jgi:transcriptional regulator with XRE-family HTH domain
MRPSFIRPPVLQATRLISLTDSHVAALFGVSQMTVSEWATGKRPIPLARHLALVHLLLHLEGTIGIPEVAAEPAEGPYAQRARVAGEIIMKLVDLTFDELGDDLPAKALEDGEAMAAAMIAKLETAAAA